MIIVKLMGGLGNQMFQYAFGLAMSERYKKELCLDIEFYSNAPNRTFDLDFYKVPYKSKGVYKTYNQIRLYVQRIPIVSDFFGIIKERREFRIDKRVTKYAYKYYTGYWQNLEYIRPLKRQLQEYFFYPEEPNLEQQQIIKDMESSESVAVHVRHGDYQTSKFNKIYHLLSESYYHKSIEYIKQQCKAPNVVFYFFSDDIEWCKSTFAGLDKCCFIDQEISGDVHVDFMLMRKCKHIITANSTFSWWAAWLKEREGYVVVPAKWYCEGKKNARAIEALIESDWKVINDN